DDEQITSYGSTVTDGGVAGYQSTDSYTNLANGNFQNRTNQQTKFVPITIENPMYKNYR
ncbi:unnamed protein product, partial [Rotaria sp. Silwood2]